MLFEIAVSIWFDNGPSEALVGIAWEHVGQDAGRCQGYSNIRHMGVIRQRYHRHERS